VAIGGPREARQRRADLSELAHERGVLQHKREDGFVDRVAPSASVMRTAAPSNALRTDAIQFEEAKASQLKWETMKNRGNHNKVIDDRILHRMTLLLHLFGWHSLDRDARGTDFHECFGRTCAPREFDSPPGEPRAVR
jgi:hypothetical protein